MVRNLEWQDQLRRLNNTLRDVLRASKAEEVLSGNLFYDHLQPRFWETELLQGCEKKRRRIFSLAKRSTSYFEVGVNGGHSMFLALSANPNLKCVGVDLCKRMTPEWGAVDIYVPEAMNWLQKEFPNQVEFLKGDCLIEVPRFVKDHPDFRVDLAHIDGAKYTYMEDVKNLWPLFYKNTRIVFDDTETQQCREVVYYLLGSGYVVVDEEFPCIHSELYQNSVVKVAKVLR